MESGSSIHAFLDRIPVSFFFFKFYLIFNFDLGKSTLAHSREGPNHCHDRHCSQQASYNFFFFFLKFLDVGTMILMLACWF